jgi:hypothetical protein
MTEERQKLSDDQETQLKPIGTSHGFIIPAAWLKTFKTLKIEPLIFYAHVEKDNTGIYIVFKKAKNPTIPEKR